MRSSVSVAAIGAGVAVAVLLAAMVVLSPARADDFAAVPPPPDGPGAAASAPCACATPQNTKPYPKTERPQFAELKPELDATDEIAALDAISVALTQVGDGGTYVWHRHHGRLSGMVQPTASFKDRAGNPCRHIVTVLTTGARTRKIEGIACRLADGRWQLDD